MIPEHWYPKNIEKRSRIDEFLKWRNDNMYLGSDMYFKTKYLEPHRSGVQPNLDEVKKYEEILTNSLDEIENFWLNNSNRFLFGNKVTIADLLTAAEIEQPRIVGYKPLEGRHRISDYIDNVKTIMHPYYEDAHSFIEDLNEGSSRKKNIIL